MSSTVTSTLQLLERYDRPGPRYTSYPTAVEFHEGFGAADYEERLAEAAALTPWPSDLELSVLHGVGPWTLTYVNQKDDPRNK